MFHLPNLGPIIALAFIGLVAVLIGIGWCIWWVIQHVRFV